MQHLTFYYHLWCAFRTGCLSYEKKPGIGKGGSCAPFHVAIEHNGNIDQRSQARLVKVQTLGTKAVIGCFFVYRTDLGQVKKSSTDELRLCKTYYLTSLVLSLHVRQDCKSFKFALFLILAGRYCFHCNLE